MSIQRTSFAMASHRHTAGAVLPILLLWLMTAIMPHALTAQTPVVTFGFNAGVNVVIPDGAGGWYVGGVFTRFDPRPSNHEVLTIANGTRTGTFPVVNGTISATIPDGSGGWYIGGGFTSVGGVTRNRLARINSDGTLHAFDPNISGSVLALALSPDGATLYAGGTFSGANSVNGNITRNRLAAFATATGTVVAGFDPNVGDQVFALALSSDGATLYAGGVFNGVNSVNGNTFRNRLAAFTTNNGTVVAGFNPNMGNNVRALALSPDGATLYAGGQFNGLNSVNGNTTRNRLAAFATATGTVIAGFNPDMNNTVRALALSSDGATLYAGGAFNIVNGGTTRNRVAAFATATGTVVAGFDPNMSGQALSLALSSDGATLYAGGEFTTVAGGATTRNRVAAFATNNGTVVAGFDPNVLNSVNCLAVSGANISIGGDGILMPIGGAVVRNRLARINSDGTLHAFDPNMSGVVNALALSPDGATLYAGGQFNGANSVNGTTIRNRLAAFATNTGTVDLGFNPNMNNTVRALALSSDGATLYAGGEFNGATAVNGTTERNYLAAFATNTGTVVPGFNPNMSFNVLALALSSNDATLYAGGAFNIVNGGTTRNYLAAFATNTGTVVPGFDPNMNSDVQAIALSSDGATLYAGGIFTIVSGGATTRNSIAAFATATGTVVAGFDPNVSGPVNALALSSDGATLYAGGGFNGANSVNGTTERNCLAAFTTNNGTVVAGFDPNVSGPVNALARSGLTLFAGGAFTTASNLPRLRIATFLIPTSATASPVAVNLGTNITGGTATTQSVTLAYANVSGNENFTYTLGGASGFAVTPTNLSTAGTTSAFNHTLTVTFTPGATAGTQNGVLWVNRAGTTLATVSLTAQLGAPPTTATASPTTLNFGTNFTSGNATTQSVSIAYANVSGSDSFTYTLGGNSAGLAVTPTTLSTSGGTSAFNHTLTLTLTPGSTAGTQSAVLWVNRAGTTLATVNLTAQLIVPPPMVTGSTPTSTTSVLSAFSMTLTGTNLSSPTSIVMSQMNSISSTIANLNILGSVISNSATQIVLGIPSGAIATIGTYSVTVATAGGSTTVTLQVNSVNSGTFMYWANAGNNSIGRAALDGSSVNGAFITGCNQPRGIFADMVNNRLYWSNEGANSIGRANLDGTGVNQTYHTANVSQPNGLFVDVGNSIIYWSNIATNSIGTATYNGSGTTTATSTLFAGQINGPRGVFVANGLLYWVSNGSSTIGRANTDGTNFDNSFITGIGVGNTNIWVDPQNSSIYWTSPTNGVRRLAITGGAGGGSAQIIAAPSGNNVDGLALFNGRFYVGDVAGNRILSVNADGSSVNNNLMMNLSQPRFIWVGQALGSTNATASPSTVNFGTNFVGGAPTTQTVTLAITNVNANDSFTYTFGGSTLGVTANENGFTTTANTSPFNRTITLSLPTGTATTVNGFLYIRSAGSSTTLATIALSGNVFPVTTLTVSPSSLNFGTVTQFDNSSTQTLTLTFNNIRAGERVTYSLTNDGGGAYTINPTTTGFTTTASQTVFTTTVTIRLNSFVTTGAKTGVLRISTNSSTTPTDIALSGTIAGINVSFTPTSLDFGNVTLGAGFATTATRTVTMTWSNARVNTNVTMTTTGSMFSREANFQLTTASGTRTITVTYNPIALGTHTGTLTITGGGAPSLVMSRAKDSEDEIAAPANNAFTQDISLSGRAVPPPPPAPTISISSIVSAGFVVGWNVPTGAESYTIDIATDANFTSLVVNNASVNTTSYTTNGLTGNTTYWVRVRAVNGQGASANSNVVSALTIPGTTTVLSTTNIGASSATLNWTAPSGGAASYTVDLSINNTFTSFVSGWNGQTTSSASVSSVSVNASGLTQGTAYFWRVRGGNATGTSANSAVQSFTTLLVPTLVSFTPNPIGQGQTLTLTGTNFATPMTVEIGSVSVTATVVSSVQATVVIPNTIVGVQSVGITTPGGSASTTQTLTIIAPPTISNVTWVITSNATGGVGNTIFTITGTNFISPSVQISQFQSDGVESGLATITGNILSSSLTQIVVSVPPSMLNVIGQYGMVVGNLAGTARFAVNYVPPPEIVSLTPNTLGASAITNARQPIVITIEGNNVVDVNGVVGGRVFSVPEFRLSTVNGGVGTGRSVREFVVNPFDITRTTRVHRLSLPLELLQAVGTYTLTLTTAGGSTSQTIRVFQDRFTVSGTLRRTDIVGTIATANQDMSGITVVWSGSEGVRSVTTNTAGSYSFAQVLPGTYTIEYRSERFRITPVSSTVMVRSDTVLSNPQEVRLRQYMMSGRITVNSGNGFTGVNQAEVNILGVGGDAGNPVVSRRLASDADGRFAGINLPSGSYQVRVSSTIGTFDMVSAQIIDRDIVIDEVLLRGRAISRATATSASVAVQGSANIGAVTEEFRNVPATAANTTVIVTRTPDFGDLVLTTRPTVNVVMARDRGYDPIVLEAQSIISSDKQSSEITQVVQERLLRLGDTVALADVQNGRVVYRPRVQQTQTDTIRFNLAFTVGATSVNSVVTVRFNVAQRPPRITAIPSPAEITVRANERPGIQWFIADDRGSFDYAGVDSIRVTRVVSSNEVLLRASNLVFGQFDRGRWHMTMPLERNTTGTTVITATFTLNFNGFTETSTQSMRVNVLPATSIRPVTEVIQSLQPNPARDMVQIVWQGKRTESARLTIVNVLGQAVQTMTVERGVEQTQIDVSRLSAGTYRVMIEDSRGMTAQALVVVR